MVGAAVEEFKRKRQNREAILATTDSVINDPSVVQAEEALRTLVDAPSVFPEGPSNTIVLCPEYPVGGQCAVADRHVFLQSLPIRNDRQVRRIAW